MAEIYDYQIAINVLCIICFYLSLCYFSLLSKNLAFYSICLAHQKLAGNIRGGWTEVLAAMVVPFAAAAATAGEGGRWANSLAAVDPIAWTAATLSELRSTNGTFISLATRLIASAQGARPLSSVPSVNMRRVKGVTSTGCAPTARVSLTYLRRLAGNSVARSVERPGLPG